MLECRATKAPEPALSAAEGTVTDWVYWRTRPRRDPSKPRRVTRLLKRQRGCCALCGLRFTTEDMIEVHHYDKNHNNTTFDNLHLMHGHCHDIVHGKGYL